MSRRFIDGSQQLLEEASVPVTHPPFTMVCWFNVDAIGIFYGSVSLAKSTVNNDDRYQMFLGRGAGNNEVSAFVDTAIDGAGESLSGNTFGATAWHHAGGVFTSTTSRRAYLDGAEGTENTTSVTIVGNVDRVTIGALGDAVRSNWMDGMIAEAAIWNVALSTSEMKSLAAGYSPILVHPSALAFYCPCIRGLAADGTGDENDRVGGLLLSEITTSGTVATDEHPRMIYPSAPYIITAPAAVGGISIPVAMHQYFREHSSPWM